MTQYSWRLNSIDKTVSCELDKLLQDLDDEQLDRVNYVIKNIVKTIDVTIGGVNGNRGQKIKK